MKSAASKNAAVWEKLYSSGHQLSYPNDVFVRVTHRLLDPARHPRVLDYGFGSGENILHLAKKRFAAAGAEISASAKAAAARKLKAAGLRADLRVIEPGGSLPFDDGAFDAVIAWQSLEYNDWDGFHAARLELERVLRPGGVFLAAINAPGDTKQRHGRSVGDHQYVIASIQSQKGARVIVPTRGALRRAFPGRALKIGDFSHNFDGAAARHWIVAFEK